MEKSQSISNLAKALILFHVKVDKIKKDANNPFFKSKYASLSNILDTIQVPLNESGLSFVQLPENEHTLTTILMHGETGEFIQSSYEMRPVKADPQGLGSAMTYQRRYALSAILGLNIDDDDDANAASKPVNGFKVAEVKQPELTPLHEKWNGAITALKAGNTTIEKIKKIYSVTKENENLLCDLSKSDAAQLVK